MAICALHHRDRSPPHTNRRAGSYHARRFSWLSPLLPLLSERSMPLPRRHLPNSFARRTIRRGKTRRSLFSGNRWRHHFRWWRTLFTKSIYPQVPRMLWPSMENQCRNLPQHIPFASRTACTRGRPIYYRYQRNKQPHLSSLHKSR